MPRHSALFVLTAALAASVSLPAHADMMSNRVASFFVAGNLPADVEQTTPTSSEIITASKRFYSCKSYIFNDKVS